MTAGGFHEAQAAFVSSDARDFVGQVRRFGPFGPAYEVVDMAQEGEVTISVIESGERLAYPVADLIGDPIAETIP